MVVFEIQKYFRKTVFEILIFDGPHGLSEHLFLCVSRSDDLV